MDILKKMIGMVMLILPLTIVIAMIYADINGKIFAIPPQKIIWIIKAAIKILIIVSIGVAYLVFSILLINGTL